LTGGGAELKHIKQLVEYITGMDTRLGYPNEHLAGDSNEEISSPMYATAVGLVMNSIQNGTNSAVKYQPEIVERKPITREPVVEKEVIEEKPVESKKEIEPESTQSKISKSFFDRYLDKIKNFLDNAE
jgi:cell division protein FtsA